MMIPVMNEPTENAIKRTKSAYLICLFLFLLVTLAACTPGVRTTAPTVAPAERIATDKAQEIYHRMRLGYLETGQYTTSVLVDVVLPRGLRWTVESFPGETFELHVSDDNVPGVHWEVTPAGVKRVQAIVTQRWQTGFLS